MSRVGNGYTCPPNCPDYVWCNWGLNCYWQCNADPDEGMSMTFADELRQWRARENYTQEKAAAFLSVPLRTYQEWEQGRQEPDQKGPIRKAIELSTATR